MQSTPSAAQRQRHSPMLLSVEEPAIDAPMSAPLSFNGQRLARSVRGMTGAPPA